MPTINDDDTPELILTESPLDVQDSMKKISNMDITDMTNIQKLIYHLSDSIVTPCIDNSKVFVHYSLENT